MLISDLAGPETASVCRPRVAPTRSRKVLENFQEFEEHSAWSVFAGR